MGKQGDFVVFDKDMGGYLRVVSNSLVRGRETFREKMLNKKPMLHRLICPAHS